MAAAGLSTLSELADEGGTGVLGADPVVEGALDGGAADAKP